MQRLEVKAIICRKGIHYRPPSLSSSLSPERVLYACRKYIHKKECAKSSSVGFCVSVFLSEDQKAEDWHDMLIMWIMWICPIWIRNIQEVN